MDSNAGLGVSLELAQEVAAYISANAVALMDTAEVVGVTVSADRLRLRLSICVDWPPSTLV